MSAEPSLLILSRDAEEYLGLLEPHLVDEPLWATAADALPAGAERTTIALGEPDVLAAAWPSLPRLQWIQSTWAGLAPLRPVAEAGVPVTGVKDVFGAQMSEYVLGHLLAHVLDLPGRRCAQRERRWDARPTGTLEGRTLGVMGTGSIGTAIAERAAAFGMIVLGFSRSGAAKPPFETVYAPAQCREFLGRCDMLVGVLPHTPETVGLLDRAALAALPPGAVLVNVGRGSLVDERALVDALVTGDLGGAVLDVFREEPLPEDHPFWSTPGVTITAHVAARSWPEDIARIFIDNLQRWRGGQTLRYRFDPSRGY